LKNLKVKPQTYLPKITFGVKNILLISSNLLSKFLAVINFTLVLEEFSGDKSTSIPISVRLTDVNDLNPVFERDIYEISIKENSPTGTVVAQVRATDEDSGLFGTEGIRYTSLTGSIANE